MNPTTKQDRSDEDHTIKPDPTFRDGTATRCRTEPFRRFIAERTALKRRAVKEYAIATFGSEGAIGSSESVAITLTAQLFNVQRAWVNQTLTRAAEYETDSNYRRRFLGYKTLDADAPERKVLEEYETACCRLLPFRDMVRLVREVPKSTEEIEQLFASLDDDARAQLRGVLDAYLMAAELAISARKMLEAAKAEAETILADRCELEPLVRNTEVV